MSQEQENEIIEWMQFVKVTVREGDSQDSGYLSDVSGKMLLVELRRHGFDVVKVDQKDLTP